MRVSDADIALISKAVLLTSKHL